MLYLANNNIVHKHKGYWIHFQEVVGIDESTTIDTL